MKWRAMFYPMTGETFIPRDTRLRARTRNVRKALGGTIDGNR